MKEIQDRIIGYHYTNDYAYKSIKDGRIYHARGLLPIRRFIAFGDGKGCGLPKEAHDGTIQGLLEPEPESWFKNSEFPKLWRPLMNDICNKGKRIILLSFEIKPEDKAYVVERAHIERELYKKPLKGEKLPEKLPNYAYQKYWESRIPIANYTGGYSVPQLTIWSPIGFERLNVEWTKSSEEVWQRIIENGW